MVSSVKKTNPQLPAEPPTIAIYLEISDLFTQALTVYFSSAPAEKLALSKKSPCESIRKL